MPHARSTLPTANERLKRSSEAWFWRGLVLAVLIHVGVFSLVPATTAAAAGEDGAETSLMAPPTAPLPPPPEDIVRPAAPVVSDAVIDDHVTITSNTDWEPGTSALPPPPPSNPTVQQRYEAFVPSMTAPRVLNRDEVEAAMRQYYPPNLRQAGIGATVDVLIWLDEQGVVQQARVAEEGPYPALDAAALRLVEVMRLSPALNRDRAVPVVVRVPVVFTVR
ncbi:MAG: TonB family protein [Gemmatimonadota bacterium]